MAPKVSVCVPVYNGARYLRECLDSVMAQTYRDVEVIIVDDGSTDESAAIASDYANRDSRIRLFRNVSNLGLVNNWNHSVRLANGEWIKFLFQDDLLAPECLARMLEIDKGEADLIVVRRQLAFAPDTPVNIRTIYNEYLEQNNLARHFSGCSVVSVEAFRNLMIKMPDRNCIGEPSAVLLRKRAFDRYGYFNSHLVSLCDWEYLARVAANTGLYYLDESMATFRVHKASQSAELRESNTFRAHTLDPLIIQHDMLYLPAYAGLREAAKRRYSERYLKYQLAEVLRRTWWDAFVSSKRFNVSVQLALTLACYPRMMRLPLGYLGELVARKVGWLRRPSASQ